MWGGSGREGVLRRRVKAARFGRISVVVVHNWKRGKGEY